MPEESRYTPPTVWTPQEPSGGTWSAINRPEAGARFEQQLPRGRHPLQLYSLGTPNGQKVTIMLEELLERGVKEAEYDAWLIRIDQGEQFGSGFVALNPNSKIPVLLDCAVLPARRVFESCHILLYLAEKFAHFLPDEAGARCECLNWLFWQAGAGPYVGGGFGHFYVYAPEKMAYPINRFTMETKRQLDVLDRQLAQHPFIAGTHYSIADMAIWPWYGGLVTGAVYNAATFLDAERAYPHVMRWAHDIAERPAVKRGRRVNRTSGDPATQLPERHDAADFLED